MGGKAPNMSGNQEVTVIDKEEEERRIKEMEVKLAKEKDEMEK